jgi:hypothetical protein
LQDSGLFVPPIPAKIAATTRFLMSSPALQTSLGARARERACGKFSWESICAAYDNALRDAIGTSAPALVATGRVGSVAMHHQPPPKVAIAANGHRVIGPPA